MNGNYTRFTAVFLCLLMVLPGTALVFNDGSSADSSSYVLIDMGDGDTYWSVADSSATTLGELISSAAATDRLSYEYKAGKIVIGGYAPVTVGSSATADVYWHYFVWDSGSWDDRTSSFDPSAAYSGGNVAVLYATDGTVPVETPEYMESWTMIGGNASNSGSATVTYSSETATLSFQTTRKTSTGESYCDTQILYARGNAYAYFGGSYTSAGPAPELVQLVRDGSGNWTTGYVMATPIGMGYETQTGAIIGDYYYLTSSYGYLYKVPLDSLGTSYTYVQISSAEVVSSDRSPAITSVMYSSDGTSYTDAVKEDMTVDAFDIPVTKGSTYYVKIKAVVDGEERDYSGTLNCSGTKADLSAIDGSGHTISIKPLYQTGYDGVEKLWIGNVRSPNFDTSGLSNFNSGLAHLTVWGGLIFASSSNGYVYCISPDLKILWQYETRGQTYGAAVTVHDGAVFAGSGNATLSAIDVTNGTLMDKHVFEVYDNPAKGSYLMVNTPVFLGNTLFVSTGDGLGMDSSQGGVAVLEWNTDVGVFTSCEENRLGICSNRLLVVDNNIYTGVYFMGPKGMYRMDESCTPELIVTTDKQFHAPPILVNGNTIILNEYSVGQKNPRTGKQTGGMVYAYDLKGNVVGSYNRMDTEVDQYNMTAPTVLAGQVFIGTDGGMFILDGSFYTEPAPVVEPDATGTTGTCEWKIYGEDLVVTKAGAMANYASDSALPWGKDITSVDIRSPVVSVGTYAFHDCSKLVSVTIASTVTSIGTGAFNGVTFYKADKTTVIDATATNLAGHSFTGTGDGKLYMSDPGPGPGPTPTPASGDAGLTWIIIAAVVVVIVLLLFALSAVFARRTGKTIGAYVTGVLGRITGIRAEGISKTTANKRRLAWILSIGILISAIAFLICLSVGPSLTVTPWEALGAACSAVGKGGKNLNLTELVVYNSRLPRAIAALSVGMGLAIAGAIYQAVIRNPLVDPYIMGVSSGAGTFAVAGIASGFTMFGLLANSNYAVPVLAITGGLLAFGLTMVIGRKAGGSSTSYVLAGVVIGLAFSSIQTVLLTTSTSDKLQNALSWLYGTFTQVDWNTVWLIFFPALFISIASLLWAKDLNLILLGEDNARQMGLDVKKFNSIMLILASVLTSICVAFVGIIGFVGLVVPHLCRMMLGGDHRLVLPASMVVGSAVMLIADLLARMLAIPLELPVGAITTVIGVPVFAYLLMSKGRMYDG